jgi:hypothetical protein
MKDNLMNVIFGTDTGKFTLHFAWMDNKARRRKHLNFNFPADKPKECLPILQKMVKAHGKITNILTSSSMNFCEEEGVTRKQVNALWTELGMERD